MQSLTGYRTLLDHKQLVEPGLSVCTSTAAGSCHRHWHGSRGQSLEDCGMKFIAGWSTPKHEPCGMGLGFGAPKLASYAHTAAKPQAGCQCGPEQGGNQEVLREIEFANTNTGVKTVKSEKGHSQLLCWLLFSLVTKTAGLLCETQWFLSGVHQKHGEAGYSTCSTFPGEGNSF